MARIIRFHETGGPDVLRIEDLPVAEPANGEVRLQVEAIGLNRAEIMFRQGRYLEAPQLPARLGYEAAGTVAALGPGVSGLRVGDRVSTIPGFSMNRYGVYGDSAIVPFDAVARYPASLSALEGASIWMQYLTAYGALVEYGRLKCGDALLVTAASSSVGLAAIQLAKAAGALVIATTRGLDKKSFLIDAGADHVVVTNEEDLAERVKAVTDGDGANLIFDPVGGPLLPQLADAATIVEYGALSSDPTLFPLFPALAKGLTVRGYTLFELVKSPDAFRRGKRFVYRGLETGALKPVIDQVFPLSDIRGAHEYMESNQQKGKIVVTV